MSLFKNSDFAVNKVKHTEVIMFYRQFAVMLKAGIPISDCLQSFQNQNFTKSFKRVLKSISTDVNSGVLLSKAFHRSANQTKTC